MKTNNDKVFKKSNERITKSLNDKKKWLKKRMNEYKK